MTFDTEYLAKDDGRYIIFYSFDDEESGAGNPDEEREP